MIMPYYLLSFLLLVHAVEGFSVHRRMSIMSSSSSSTDTVTGAIDKDYGMKRNCDRRFVIGSTIATAASSFFVRPPLASATDADSSIDASSISPNKNLPTVTKRVYLDVQIGDKGDPGRIVIGLFGELMPRASENFEQLCKEQEDGKSYAGTTFYRVLSKFTVQGGAVGNPVSGKTGKSAFGSGEPFAPDNYRLRHSREGLVSAVRGIDGNIDSRFFINTSDDGGWADDRYAAFGIVQQGMDLVHNMEKVDVQPPQNRPKVPIKIIGSGVLETVLD